MRQTLLLSLLLVFFSAAFAQPNQWVWVSGDSVETPGVYGTKGIADPANKPPGRSASSKWVDLNGNLWLYGGFGTWGNHTERSNDLWKYSPTENQWTWIGGDSTISSTDLLKGRYGTKGVALASNKPGARSEAVSWTDFSGNFWMFGGYGYGSSGPTYLNDLWKYSPSSNLWTWMAGDTVFGTGSSYGTPGVAASGNKPGGRTNGSAWVDRSGNLWLFGGDGYDANGNNGKLSDLWKFSPSDGLWAYMKGTQYASSYGAYGTKGVQSGMNTPGGKTGNSNWTDTSGNLWMFGGNTFEVFSTGNMNDLWRYSIAANQWTWMGGANTRLNNQNALKAVYGQRGIPDTANHPGSTFNGQPFTDSSGNLWLLGGTGLNLFWRYTPGTNQWTWMYGDTTTNPERYGSKGVPAPSNNPGFVENRTFWSDASGNLWLFFHFKLVNSFGFYINDLWKFSVMASTLPVKFSSFTAQTKSQTVVLNWSTAQEQNSCCFIVERSADGAVFESIGKVAARGTSSSLSSYSFSDNHPLQANAFYRLQELDLDGKKTYSAVIKTTQEDVTRFTILSNPVQDVMTLNVQLPSVQNINMDIRDMAGKLLIRKEYQGVKGSSLYWIPVAALAKGTYIIQLQTSHFSSTKTFIKQ